LKKRSGRREKKGGGHGDRFVEPLLPARTENKSMPKRPPKELQLSNLKRLF